MKRSGFSVMARLIGLVRPLAGFMLLAVLMGLAGHLCAAFLTVLGGCAVLEVTGLGGSFPWTWLAAALALLALLRGFLRYGEQACNHFIAFKLLALLREKVFLALRRLCPAKLEGKDRGNLISLITSDIELLEVFYAHTISPVAIAALFTLILCLFIGSFHWALGLLAFFAYAVVGVAVPLVTSKLSGDDGLRFREKSGELSSFVLDSLRGLSEILQYGCGEERLREMNTRTHSLSQDEEQLKQVAGRNQAVTHTVLLLFDLAMLFASLGLYATGQVGFAGVLLPTLALMSSFGPCVALASLGSTLQHTFAAGNRILDILDESPVVEEVSGKAKTSFSGAAAEQVVFAYGEEKILDHVSVEIPQGSVVGIVGKSGSGKSTLLKLFMRFWEAQQGRVAVSDRDVGRINTADLREMESFVTQETHLFRDSIRENLCLAKLDATQEELVEACKKASVHDFIQSLPQGYDTPVGELGATLSGGERQRLGLARAFLHQGEFLLLDEPTSNLDSLNEGVILRSLGEEREGRTVVLVSHRQSTMKLADRVYSVENGRMS